MKLLKSFAMGILVIPALLVGEEKNQVFTDPCSVDEELAKQVKVDPQEKEEEETLEAAGFGIVSQQYPPILHSAAHHWMAAVAVLDNNDHTLELEDGSIWKVSSYDTDRLLSWRVTNPLDLSGRVYLTITQNSGFFTSYNYRIVHKDGTSIEANLHLGPVLGGQYSRSIIGIDQGRKEVILNDNSRWDLSYLDQSAFNQWGLNDSVIIGVNSHSSIWDSERGSILINANMNNHARAKQL